MILHTISDFNELVTNLASRITKALPAHKTGVLFLSGGSCIPLEAALSRVMPEIKNLHVILTDERYGAVGHADSNWAQLIESGFQFEKFTSHPTLAEGSNPTTTVSTTQATLRSLLEKSDYTIAIFGMGLDGHTAGLLPHSSALHSAELYAEYKAENFHRITITPPVFEHIDYAAVYTAGDEKRCVLDELDQNGMVDESPILLVKQCRKFDIYNLTKES